MKMLLQLFTSRVAALAAVALFIPAGLAIAYIAIDPQDTNSSVAGLASSWIIAALAAYWALDELLREQTESGFFHHYLAAGKQDHLFWQWLIAGTGLTITVWVLALLVSIVLFGIRIQNWQPMLIAGLLYAIGASSVLVFTRAISALAGLGTLIGSTLSFPLQLPVLLACIQYSQAGISTTIAEGKWMLLAAFFGILYTLLGQWSLPFLIKE